MIGRYKTFKGRPFKGFISSNGYRYLYTGIAYTSLFASGALSDKPESR